MNSLMSATGQSDGLEIFSRTVRKLTHLNLTALQAEVLRELMNGNRTMAELTLAIFQSDYKKEQYGTYLSRIRRAIKSLEKAGFVSKKKLLGRDKPYGLTVHGAARIASIIPDMPRPVILALWDYALFSATVPLGVIAWFTIDPILTNLFSLCLGMTAIRALHLLRRVL